MRIKDDHRLYHDDDTPFSFVESPNFYEKVDFDYLIWHYTANNVAASAINVLSKKQNPKSNGVSAHLVIDLDGTITQLVPFNKGAWHAGESHWEGKRHLNHNSIGIEIVNDGKLKRVGNTTQWVASSSKIYEESSILVARHPHEFPPAGWPLYPQAQLDAVLEVSRLLVNHYNLKDALGHEDIADARIGKIDPGPAFPKDDFREQLFNRRQPAYVTYMLNDDEQLIEDLTGDSVSKLKNFPPQHPLSPLPPDTVVNDVDFLDSEIPAWASGKFKGAKIWIHPANLNKVKQTYKTKDWAVVYLSRPQSPKDHLKHFYPLKKGALIRKLREDGGYVLIKTLQPAAGRRQAQGWIPSGTFSRVETAV